MEEEEGLPIRNSNPEQKELCRSFHIMTQRTIEKTSKEQTRTPPSASSSGEEKHWMHGDEVLLRDIGDAVKLARGDLFCSDFW